MLRIKGEAVMHQSEKKARFSISLKLELTPMKIMSESFQCPGPAKRALRLARFKLFVTPSQVTLMSPEMRNMLPTSGFHPSM